MTESKPTNWSGNVATVGLLVLATFSLAAAWGRKPPKEEVVKVTLRALSPSEVMAILQKFPEMVPSWLASAKNDTHELARTCGSSEVTAGPLKIVFPAARFYKGLDLDIKPPYPYLMAIVGHKREMMPDQFNGLLVNNDVRMTDKNIVALAKAFVVLAVGHQRVFGNPIFGGPQGDELLAFPKIVLLDCTRTNGRLRGVWQYEAEVDVKVNEQEEKWYFDVSRTQFRSVIRTSAKGVTIDAYFPSVVESLPKR